MNTVHNAQFRCPIHGLANLATFGGKNASSFPSSAMKVPLSTEVIVVHKRHACHMWRAKSADVQFPPTHYYEQRPLPYARGGDALNVNNTDLVEVDSYGDPDYGPWLCRDCQIDVHKSGDYAYMLKNSVWRKVELKGNGVLCIACVEACLGRELRAEDLNETAPLTMRGYLTNPVLRKRMGQLTPTGYATIQTLYRKCVPSSLSFVAIAASILGISDNCIRRANEVSIESAPYFGEDMCRAL
jgi:hypothetical protein